MVELGDVALGEGIEEVCFYGGEGLGGIGVEDYGCFVMFEA